MSILDGLKLILYDRYSIMKNEQNIKTITSPNSKLKLQVGLSSDETIWYELDRNDKPVVRKSTLTLLDADGENLLRAQNDVSFSEDSFDNTWEQPWGEQRHVRDQNNELALMASNFTIRFRLFDDGLGFRYELRGEGDLTISKELTEFNVDTSSSAWWIPALGGNHYEHPYKRTKINEIATAHTPLTIELPDKTYLSIHEAALYSYGALNIVPTEDGIVSNNTPLKSGNLAEVKLPFNVPWRTITVSETATGLTTSRIMLNLNEPSKIEDTSWIKPSKFMGIWWGMFIEHFTWETGPKHGATTANAFRYINAAKKLGISSLLIEGWNEGWDGDWTKNGDKMNLMKPTPDFDIHAITGYAKSQGVDIIGHHETSGNARHYEWQLPEAYDYYKHFGVRYIKTGYVSSKFNNEEFHSSQVGVEHYQKTVEMAAERKIMLDIHEPVKGTGIERTWPNLMTREGVMGQEYEGGAITPEHATVLPFTRCLAGPLDYTPGLFNLSGTSRKVSSSLAKQLALYVTMYSPLQMVADIPEHYEGQPAFKFIQDVPVNWETTIPLDGVIGDFFVTARKDRDSDDWYVGAVSDENARSIKIKLDFLSEHSNYLATVYRDTEETHWQTNPESHAIDHRRVSHGESLDVYLAPGGGCAVKIELEGKTNLPYPT